MFLNFVRILVWHSKFYVVYLLVIFLKLNFTALVFGSCCVNKNINVPVKPHCFRFEITREKKTSVKKVNKIFADK